MKELKFIVWDFESVRYDVTGFEHGKKNEMTGVFLDGDYYPISSNPVMQYAGLKDKNGDEIYYDCHIFKFKWMTSPKSHDELIGVMTFNDEELRAEIDIYPENNPQGYVCLSYLGNGQMSDFEIIGNIHENPELLK